MEASAIVFNGVNDISLTGVEIPPPGSGEVLIETAYSCISPGTELRCLAGLQDGAVFPFIPGYSLTGTVIAAGPDTTLTPGARVFCTGTARASLALTWGGHVSHAVRPASSVYPLPAGVDLLAASITHMAAIAYHGLRLSRPQLEESVVVVGLGLIGQLSARLHALTGARVVCYDLAAQRVALAQQAGLTATSDAAEVRALLPGGAHLVVDAIGIAAAIPQAMAFAHALPWDDSPPNGARFMVQGSYPTDFAVPYMAAFMKELTLLIPRDCQPHDIRTIIPLLERGQLAADGVIGEVAAPQDAPRIYGALRQRDSGWLTCAFRWGA